MEIVNKYVDAYGIVTYTIRLDGCSGGGSTYSEARENLQRALINKGIMNPTRETEHLFTKNGTIIYSTRN